MNTMLAVLKAKQLKPNTQIYVVIFGSLNFRHKNFNYGSFFVFPNHNIKRQATLTLTLHLIAYINSYAVKWI